MISKELKDELDYLLIDAEKIIDDYTEREDQYDDRIEQEKNAICAMRNILDDGVELAIKQYFGTIAEIYGEEE